MLLFLLIASILFYILALDGSIGMMEGIAFLFLFVLYIVYKFNTPEHIPEQRYAAFSFAFMKRKKTASIKEYQQALEEHMSKSAYKKLLKEGIDVKKAYKQALIANIWKNALIIALCCAAIIFAARYLVEAAIDLAMIMGISTEFIGLSVVAFGTSLPELSVTLSAIKKKLPNILIGNLLGSGITNILFVLGVTSIIHPLSISTFDIVFGIPYVILMALLCLKFIKVNWMSQVLSGITLFFFYAVFIFGSFLLTWL